MSKILNKTGYRELSHIVECNGKKYFIDSNYTFDYGYEKMEKQHYIICNNLENYIDVAF